MHGVLCTAVSTEVGKPQTGASAACALPASLPTATPDLIGQRIHRQRAQQGFVHRPACIL